MFGHWSSFCWTGHSLTVHIPWSRRSCQLLPHSGPRLKMLRQSAASNKSLPECTARVRFCNMDSQYKCYQWFRLDVDGCSLVDYWPPSGPRPPHPHPDITTLKGHPESCPGRRPEDTVSWPMSLWNQKCQALAGEKVCMPLIGQYLMTQLLIGCLGFRELKLVTLEVKSNNRCRWCKSKNSKFSKTFKQRESPWLEGFEKWFSVSFSILCIE